MKWVDEDIREEIAKLITFCSTDEGYENFYKSLNGRINPVLYDMINIFKYTFKHPFGGFLVTLWYNEDFIRVAKKSIEPCMEIILDFLEEYPNFGVVDDNDPEDMCVWLLTKDAMEEGQRIIIPGKNWSN